MDKQKSRKPRGPYTYSMRFSKAMDEALREDLSVHSLANGLREMSSEEIEAFFGTDRRAVQREFWRWQEKLSDPGVGMAGTIKNLEVLCTLTQKTPNDVLLTPEERRSRTESGENTERQYLARKTISDFLDQLHVTKKLRCAEYRIPVLFSQPSFSYVFLRVYSDKASKIHAQFSINYWDLMRSSDSTSRNDKYFGFEVFQIGDPLDVSRSYAKASVGELLSMKKVSAADEKEKWRNRLDEFLGDAYDQIDSFMADEVSNIESEIEVLYEEFFHTVASEKDGLFKKVSSSSAAASKRSIGDMIDNAKSK